MWVAYSLFCALSLAMRDSFVKALSARKESKYLFISVVIIATGLTTLAYHLAVARVDIRLFFSPESLRILAFLLPLESAATLMYYVAISISPLSLTIPFLTLSPALVPLFSYLILGEGVSPVVYIGIFLVVIGGYVLFFESPRQLLEPFRNFFKEKGSVLMFLTAIIYSVTAVLVRKMVLVVGHGNMGAFYPLMSSSLIVIGLFAAGKLKAPSRQNKPPVLSRKKTALLLSGAVVAGSMMVTFHFIAAGMVNAAYMISVKRTSALFALIFAHFIFKEKDLLKRLAGIILMLCGVLLVTLLSNQ